MLWIPYSYHAWASLSPSSNTLALLSNKLSAQTQANTPDSMTNPSFDSPHNCGFSAVLHKASSRICVCHWRGSDNMNLKYPKRTKRSCPTPRALNSPSLTPSCITGSHNHEKGYSKRNVPGTCHRALLWLAASGFVFMQRISIIRDEFPLLKFENSNSLSCRFQSSGLLCAK